MELTSITNNKKHKLAWLIVACQLILLPHVYAQRVQPMVFELQPIGSQSTTSLRIENNQQQAMTVELIASKISLDEYGKETLIPADNDFLIYPPQALIEKGKTQIVQVKYVGDPQIAQSEAYRVSVKQLPVNLKQAGHTGVGMLINFNTLLNVVPEKSEAIAAVTKINSVDDSKWEITIENTGNRFLRLSKTSWVITNTEDPSMTRRFKSLEVGELTDKNLLLPNTKLRLHIPAIEGFDPKISRIDIVTS